MIFICVLVAIADSPCDDNEPRSEFTGTSATPLTSRLLSEPSAVHSGVLSSSQVSLRPLVPVTSQPSIVLHVQTTASGPAPSGCVTLGCREVTSDTSVSPVMAEPRRELLQQMVVGHTESAGTSSNTSLSRNEVTCVPQSSTGFDESIGADRQTSSPEIDILPAVKRLKVASDGDSVGNGVGSADIRECRSTVEPDGGRSSAYRCGSPGLDEVGEFSHHKPKLAPGTVTLSQSNPAGGVTLIPLSQVMSTSDSSDMTLERPSVKISHVDKISTKPADDKSLDNQNLSQSLPRSNEQATSVQVPKATRRRSTRLRVPERALGRVKHPGVDGTKSVKFSIPLGNDEPTDKENVCMQRTTQQQAVTSSQQESEEISHLSPKSHTNPCNTSGKESDVSSAKVRRSFIKCARLDGEPADRQRLPTAWERHTDRSPVAGRRRMSDRIKREEGDTQPSECEKSPGPVTGRKRSASSSSSGPSSCEKKSVKKVTRTIAMTSLHSE